MRTFVPMALASAIWYGGITLLGSLIGAEWERIIAIIAGVNRTLGIVAAGPGRGRRAPGTGSRRRRRGAGAGLARHPGRARPRRALVSRRAPRSPRAPPGEAAALLVLELAYADPVLTPDDRALVAEHLRDRWGLGRRRHSADAGARGGAAHPIRATTPAGSGKRVRPRRSGWSWWSGCGPSRSATAPSAPTRPGSCTSPPSCSASRPPSWPTCAGACSAAGSAMTVPDVREQIDRDFWLEGFRDFLALEAGHSANTVEAYLRDLRRLGEFAALARGARSRPGHPHAPARLRLPAQGPGPQRRDDPARGLGHPDLLRISGRRGPRRRRTRATGWRRRGAAGPSPIP